MQFMGRVTQIRESAVNVPSQDEEVVVSMGNGIYQDAAGGPLADEPLGFELDVRMPMDALDRYGIKIGKVVAVHLVGLGA